MEEENMKKLIALMLSILMVCSLAACASKQDSASGFDRNRVHRSLRRGEDAHDGNERCLPAV